MLEISHNEIEYGTMISFLFLILFHYFKQADSFNTYARMI